MIETQWIDGLLLREMILAGTANLEKNREMVDALNVFPVPDGDTGTNMSLTMKSAAREVSSKEYATAGAAADAIAKGALRGARGNSGVITSQLLRGFARSVEGLEKINPLQFAQALKAGADKAYKAVMKPKEGTILTVARVIAEEAVKQAQSAPDEFVDDHDAIEEIKFAYCTKFEIRNLRNDAKPSDITTFRRYLNRIGDNVLVDGDLSLLKIHVHTNDPGKALQYGLSLGELMELKIENMVETRRQVMAQKAKEEPPKEYGMVSVAQGDGFASILRDLGVDVIVEGGQTMNPSIEDLSKAVGEINAKTVFILPNNGNVILAAQQAAEISDKNVLVIPTKNVAMGIAAVVAFQQDASPEENAAAMDEAAQRVRTGTITYAVRDSEFEDLHITEGDIIGLYNGKVSVRSNSIHEVAIDLMKALVTEDDSLITIYYGADTKQEDAEALSAELQDMYPDCDVEVLRGGQPLYYYLLSVE